MKWFHKKNNLDEMQELKLLKLESRGFWLGFFGLFISIPVQIFLYSEEVKGIITGEFIVLLCMGIYLIAGCLKNGIWDRHLQATPQVNIGVSILAAALTALFNAIMSYRNDHSIGGAVAVFIVYFFMVGIVVSVTMCLCTAFYQRKRTQLEEECEEESTDADTKQD